VTANIAPRLCAQLHAAWASGDLLQAMEIQARLLPLHDAMFAESNPGPVKYAASLLGYGAPDCRLPLAPIAEANAAKMRAAMAELGLLEG
jgi:4-hydroxy-tetrahydrodipicolinate synthase